MQKRAASISLVCDRGRSVAQACRTTALARSTYDYKLKRDRKRDDPLRARMLELSSRFKRWGLPRLHKFLKAEGLVKNVKRTERIYYREEKLQIKKRKRRKKLSHMPRIARPKASRPNEVWSMDFVHDWLAGHKRKLKCLTIIDDFTKEAIAIIPAHSMSGLEVTRHLENLGRKPERLRTDNGPEFVSLAMIGWTQQNGIVHELITPGKPNENAYIESFNSRYRDECLNEHLFFDLADAREKIEAFRLTYNEFHPHSSLGMKSPKEFAEEWQKLLPA